MARDDAQSVVKRASLAARTVEDIGKGKIPTPVVKGRRERSAAPGNEYAFAVITPAPVLWEYVQATVASPDNSYTRFELVSDTEAIIR